MNSRIALLLFPALAALLGACARPAGRAADAPRAAAQAAAGANPESAARPAADAAEAAAIARLVVSPPGMHDGDYDQAAAALVGAAREHQHHPLAHMLLRRATAFTDKTANRGALLESLAALGEGASPVDSAGMRLSAQIARRDLMLMHGDEAGLLRSGDLFPGFVRSWAVIGPFGDAHPDTLAVAYDPERGLPIGEAATGLGKRAVRWMQATRRTYETHVDLSEASDLDEGSNYARAQLKAARSQGVYLDLSAPGSIAAWWNGDEVFRRDTAVDETRPIQPIPVVLRAGWNQLLIKLERNGSDWVGARVHDGLGRAVDGLENEAALVEHGTAPAAAASAAKPAPWLTPDARIDEYLNHLSNPADRAALLAMRGLTRSMVERDSEAVADLRAAAKLLPEDAELQYALAEVVTSSQYLPEAEAKNRARESVDRLLAAKPASVPGLMLRADLLARDDRFEDALAALQTAATAAPKCFLVPRRKAEAFRRLNWAAEYAKAQADALRLAPGRADLHAEAARMARQAGNAALENKELEASAAIDAGNEAVLGRRIELWLLSGEGARAVAEQERLVRLHGTHRSRSALAHTLESLGRPADALELLSANAAKHPNDARAQRDVAELKVRMGQDAKAAYTKALDVAPGDEVTRAWFREAGGGIAGDDLFEKYRADWKKAISEYKPNKKDEKAPDTQLIDLQVERVLRDGSTEKETTAVYRINDLKGVEQHGSARFFGELQELKVVHADLTFDEPTPAGGDYALSKLQPGDFVVIRYRAHDELRPGQDPMLGRWTFQSQERSFLISRYVLALPRTHSMKIVEKNFDGDHETFESPDEIVHIYTKHQAERVIPERLQPDATRFLPWMQVGVSLTPEQLYRYYRAQLHRGIENTVEIAEAAQSVLEKPATAPASRPAYLATDRDKALALFTFVNDTLIERAGSTATRSLLEKRGNPFVLYASLLSAAGIPYESAMARPLPLRAEDDPAPEILDTRPYNYPLLRVRPKDGEPIWVDVSMRMQPFGLLPMYLSGAEVMVMATGGPVIERLPAVPDDEWGQGELQSTVKLTGGQGATITVELTLRNSAAWTAREQLKNLSSAERRTSATQIANQVIQGIDLEDVHFTTLDDRDAPLRVVMEGKLPNYLRQGAAGLEAPLLMQPIPLAKQLSDKGKRKLPMRFPRLLFWRERLKIIAPDSIKLADAPAAVVKKEQNAHYSLRVTKEGNEVTVERTLLIPPCEIAAADVPSFLTLCRVFEEADQTKLGVTAP